MKIVHICLNSYYTDGFGYQDNLLPKYHKRIGNNVSIITSKFCFDKGKIVLDNRDEYENEYGVKVIRLSSKYDSDNHNRDSLKSKFNTFYNLYETIEKEKPDVLFIHGLNYLDIKTITKYLKRHKEVIAYADNHSDYSNSATSFISKYILHRIIWKHYAKMINPYIKKFYGVLPARVDFLVDNYGLLKSKCSLLIMGADDDLVNKYCTSNNRKELRKKLDLSDEDFVIVTGGKIDSAKLQTLLLMKAVKNIENKKIKLVIFGSVEEKIKDDLQKLLDDRIKYVGWISNEEAYQYFNMADLVVFPGRHSVYWEIVVAIGVPLICKYWDGTTHVDIGGNVEFIKEDSVEEIQKIIEKVSDTDYYNQMKNNSQKDKKKEFLYSEVARKSLE